MSTVIDLSQVATQANRELADASAGEIMSWANSFWARVTAGSSWRGKKKASPPEFSTA